MANAAKMAGEVPVRALIVGYPGAGKTGTLASLIDAGYKIRMLDYDGNTEPIFAYVKDQSKLANVDIVHLEDKMRTGTRFTEPAGLPTAFKQGLDMMDRWKYTEVDGTVVDLGASKDWGFDTIVVLDSLTEMGEAAKRRVASLQNKGPGTITQQTWLIAQGEQEAFISRLTSTSNRFHVIVMAHLTMVGPKDIMKDDTDLTKELKERTANLVPTRLFPSALGQALPPKIGGHFPTLLRVEPKFLPGGVVQRIIRTIPLPELDIKVPAKNLPPTLPIEDGMLTIFKALTPASVAAVSGTTGDKNA